LPAQPMWSACIWSVQMIRKLGRSLLTFNLVPCQG
jgi:hypothetical protein